MLHADRFCFRFTVHPRALCSFLHWRRFFSSFNSVHDFAFSAPYASRCFLQASRLSRGLAVLLLFDREPDTFFSPGPSRREPCVLPLQQVFFLLSRLSRAFLFTHRGVLRASRFSRALASLASSRNTCFFFASRFCAGAFAFVCCSN